MLLASTSSCLQTRGGGTAQDCFPAPLRGQHLQAPSDASVLVPSGMPARSQRTWLRRSLSPPSSTSLPDVTLRGAWPRGMRPRPDETRVEPQFQMQTGALRGKTWQAGCISSGVRNPEKQQVASGALFLSVSWGLVSSAWPVGQRK